MYALHHASTTLALPLHQLMPLDSISEHSPSMTQALSGHHARTQRLLSVFVLSKTRSID